MLEFGVGVDETLVQAPRELAAECGFSCTRQADQKQIAPVQRNRGMGWEGDGFVTGRGIHRTEVTESLTMRGVRKIRSSVLVDVVLVVLNR